MRAKELRLGSDAGRTCRPLFIVDDNKIRLTREHIHKLRLPEVATTNTHAHIYAHTK
jgi:DNA-directed RNA polymerase II subunit RPB2